MNNFCFGLRNMLHKYNHRQPEQSYRPLRSQSIKEVHTGLNESYKDENYHDTWHWTGGKPSGIAFIVVFLVAFFLLDIVLLFQSVHCSTQLCKSPYVGMDRTIPVEVTRNNQSLENAIWDDPKYDGWLGVVALNDSFVQEHDLLPAQKYPWDLSRTMYFIHGFHSLHCVKLLRDSILETQRGEPWKKSFTHITHCLNVLREDIVCYADDFPRYTGALNAQVGTRSSASGLGAIRYCRDWNQLHQFALENPACYKPVPPVPTTFEQYKFCPDSSKPWELDVQKD